MLKVIKLISDVSASGAVTVVSSKVTGLLHAVEWIDGTLDNGVDAVLTLTRDGEGADITLLTLTDANNDAVYMPRYATHGNTGTALTLDGTRPATDKHFINGALSLSITDGGNAKRGGCFVYLEC